MYKHTATDDLQFRLLGTEMWLSNVNLHCVTNDADYGNVTEQPAEVTAGDILVFEKVNLADLYFKNAGAGSNTTIYAVGITMSKKAIDELLGGM